MSSRLGNNPLAKKKRPEEHVVRVMYRRGKGGVKKTKPVVKAKAKPKAKPMKRKANVTKRKGKR